MRSFLLLFLVSFVTFGQEVVDKDAMFSPERKRFTETCVNFANDIVSADSTTDFNKYFTNGVSEAYATDLAKIKNQITSFDTVNYKVTADLNNANVYVVVFELGENAASLKKLFLLFDDNDNLVDDYMVIAEGLEQNTKEEVVPYSGNELEIPTTTITVRIADAN